MNGVYKLEYLDCPLQYIGQTEQYNEHTLAIKHNKDTSTYTHNTNSKKNQTHEQFRKFSYLLCMSTKQASEQNTVSPSKSTI